MARRSLLFVAPALLSVAAVVFAVSYSGPARGSGIAVTNADDAGAGSLRQAILDANASAGHDTITFDPIAFPSGSPTVIMPVTALPGMDDPAGTTVDGTGAGVVIDGSLLGANEDGLVFHTSAGVDLMDATVRSLTVRSFPRWGIYICGGDPAGPCIDDDNVNPTLDDVTVSLNGHHGAKITGNSVVNASITDSSAVSNGFHGFEINSCGGIAVGSVVTGNTTIFNDRYGLEVNACDNVANTLISGNIASTNGDSGIGVNAADNVLGLTIGNNLASNNGDQGVYVNASDAVTDVLINGNTTNGNGQDGLHVNSGGTLDEAIITGNLTRLNQSDGVYLDGMGGGTENADVKGNVICGNTVSGLNNEDPIAVDATGNWWGDALGPAGPGDDVIGGGAAQVDFNPWIDTISASADQAAVAVPSTVRFQFSDAVKTVFLGQGLSSLNPFTVTTDNGTLMSPVESGASVDTFINEPNGVLSVMLTPDTAGTATVSVTGPCGLDGTLGGNSIEVGVSAVLVTPTPTPTPTATPTPMPTASPTSTPTATPTPTGTPIPDRLQGDVDCDGDVDAVDALKILQFVAGLPFEQGPGCPMIGEEIGGFPFGDVDCDGDVDAVDALKVLQFIAAIPFGQMEPCVDIGQPLE